MLPKTQLSLPSILKQFLVASLEFASLHVGGQHVTLMMDFAPVVGMVVLHCPNLILFQL